MKKITPVPTPDSYKHVLTHSKVYEFETSKWYYVSLFVWYIVALETAGQYLIFGRRVNRVVDFLDFIIILFAIVFLNDYIFYRIAKRNK